MAIIVIKSLMSLTLKPITKLTRKTYYTHRQTHRYRPYAFTVTHRRIWPLHDDVSVKTILGDWHLRRYWIPLGRYIFSCLNIKIYPAFILVFLYTFSLLCLPGLFSRCKQSRYLIGRAVHISWLPYRHPCPHNPTSGIWAIFLDTINNALSMDKKRKEKKHHVLKYIKLMSA